jgi:hypothetical protein
LEELMTIPENPNRRSIHQQGQPANMGASHEPKLPENAKPGRSTLGEVCAELSGAGSVNPLKVAGHPANSISDPALVVSILSGWGGEKYSRLWSGDWTQYASPVEADIALCMGLAKVTGMDLRRVDRLFRQTGRFDNRWDMACNLGGATYGQWTIAAAVERIRDSGNPFPDFYEGGPPDDDFGKAR